MHKAYPSHVAFIASSKELYSDSIVKKKGVMVHLMRCCRGSAILTLFFNIKITYWTNVHFIDYLPTVSIHTPVILLLKWDL